MNKKNLRWLYLDFNSYFATIEQQTNPLLRNQPVAVVPTITDYTCAIAASYEAKKAGIRTGTMIFEAKKLCPGIICIQADHEKYIAYHHKLINEINKYIPIESICSIDEVACKLLGKECYPKNAVSLAMNIKLGIKKNVGDYISCSIGLSVNKFLAKTASNLKKPNGLKIIFKDTLPYRIEKLKLSDLTGIGNRMEQRLELANIKTINNLYQLSPKNMRKLWGSVQGEKFWHMLQGNDIEEVPTKTNTIGHSHVLHPNWRKPEFSKYILSRLVLKAASRLRRKKYFCKKMKIYVKIRSGHYLEGKEKFSKINDSITLLEKSDLIWKKILLSNKIKSIKQISIILYDLENLTTSQTNFLKYLDNSFEITIEKRKKLSNTIDTINSKFGRDSVTIGSLPKNISIFSGTKVAFTRIPDIKEFYE
jgi:DNA polymerase-4